MKKKDNTKRITTFLKKIDWMFDLNNYERAVKEIKEQPPEHPELAAEIKINSVYKELIIDFYPYFFELDLDQQRKAILHELVHTVLSETKELSIDLLRGNLIVEKQVTEENEKATTRITHLLDCLLRVRLDYARKAYKEYLK